MLFNPCNNRSYYIHWTLLKGDAGSSNDQNNALLTTQLYLRPKKSQFYTFGNTEMNMKN